MRSGFILGLLLLASPLTAQTQSHDDAAREVLRLMKYEQSVQRTQDQVYSYMEAMMAQFGVSEDQGPDTDRHLQKLVDAMNEEMTWEKMEPYLVDAYVNVYSEKELKELAEFYSSPLGQKVVAKMPELAEASMQASQQMMQDFLPRLQEIQEELRAELDEGSTN
jgi:hypothetical protein